MLSIYNETRTPWEIDTINDSVLRIKKVKTRITGEEEKTRSVSVIAYAPLFEDLGRLKYLLTTIRESTSPTVISNKESALVFNKKEFKPFIAERGYNFKNILLGSLFLKGKKVLNIKNNGTFLLEFFLHGGELTFITSFNNVSSNMIIDLWDEQAQKIIKYTFFVKNGKFLLHKEEQPSTQSNYEASHIRIFRPSRPTNLILVHPKDLKELKNTVDEQYYNIHVYTNIRDEIKRIKEENYKAVTLFAKSEWNKETEEEKTRYNYLIDILKQEFQVVFKLHKHGKVCKERY